MKRNYSFRNICFILVFLLLSMNIQVMANTTVYATSISLNKTSDVLMVGETDTLIATVLPTNATNKSVKWASSNLSVAYVFNGTVMAVGAGTTVITATTDLGLPAICIVTVNKPVITISLDKTSDELKVGEADTLTATVTQTTSSQSIVLTSNIVWASSNPNVAYVYNGKITGMSVGTTVITAKTDDGSNIASCYVTVTAPNSILALVLNKTADFLKVGGIDTLTATVIQQTMTDQTVIWTSSDTNIVKVVQGVLIASSVGSATITATTVDGSKTASCYVTVYSTDSAITFPTSISINKTTDTLIVGETDTLTATVSPSTATNKNIIWTTSNTDVVTVADGIITAVGAGTATVTAFSSNGNESRTCNITVNNLLSGNITTTRLGGSDRYETSASISKSGWSETSSYAVLATGNNYPDALSAAPLAKEYSAPILLAEKDLIPESTLSEIKRLKVSYVFILGGTGVISKAVENQLNAMGITIERLGGNDRFETSIKIAEKLNCASGEIMVANGYAWEESLSASSIAAIKGIPIILTDKNQLPSSLKTFINKYTFTKTYILGDTDLISNTVANMFTNQERIVGSNQYERNINIIKRFKSDISFNNICIATGKDFPDALSGSALATKLSSAIVLMDDNNLKAVTSEYINEKSSAINSLYIFGQQGAVSNSGIRALFNK